VRPLSGVIFPSSLTYAHTYIYESKRTCGLLAPIRAHICNFFCQKSPPSPAKVSMVKTSIYSGLGSSFLDRVATLENEYYKVCS
jgi:hypothetical protein